MTYFSMVTGDLSPKRVGILGFDGVAALDLTGPLEAIAKARHPLQQDGEPTCYKSIIVGLTGKTFVSESGILFKADATAENVGPLDTVIVPGGKGLRQLETSRRAGAWLASRAAVVRRIASVSTGIYALAQSGLVDGLLATTHWRFFRDVAQRFPKLRLTNSAAFLKEGKFYTSAGGTAGIEMTLALIEEDYGGQVALAVARELVMRLRPPGDGGRDFEPVHYQYDPTERIADLPAWIAAHLHETLTVDSLAERACLCPRHFSRVFKQIFHCTPGDFVEELRLTEARRRLLGLHGSVESIAESVGFKSSDAFRRAFERKIGVSPSAFRRQSRLATNAKSRHPIRAAA